MSNSNDHKFSKSPSKFLSVFVDRMVPDYVREEHPMFITFMRKYFEYLERETDVNGELGEFKQISDLVQNLDIDHALDKFIPEFEKQYIPNVPKESIDPTILTTDKAFLTKNIKETYTEKGTTNALNFLFKRDFDTSAEIIYPKQWMMKASGSVWYEPKWINVGGHNIISSTKENIEVNSPNEPEARYYLIENEEDLVPSSINPNHTKITINDIEHDYFWEDEIAPENAHLLHWKIESFNNENVNERILNGMYLVIANANVISNFYRLYHFQTQESSFSETVTIYRDEYFSLNQQQREGDVFTHIFDGIEKIVRYGFVEIVGDQSLVWKLQLDVTLEAEKKNIYKLYNKKIIGSVSGAEAFVDIEEGIVSPDVTRLLLTEINGNFIEGEEVIEDVGTSGNIAKRAKVTSDGLVNPGTCYINGVSWSSHNSNSVPTNKEDCVQYKNGVTLTSSDPSEGEITHDVQTAVWLANGYWLDSGSFLSSDRKLQDNDYYQDFSYVVRSSVPVQAYREVLKQLVHPVGLKLFAEYLFDSRVQMSVDLPEDYAVWLISIFSYLDVAMDIWTPGQEYGHYHGQNYTWTRPAEYELTAPLVIPAGVPLWDGSINQVELVIPLGTCSENMTWIGDIATEVECAGILNTETDGVGVWTKTIIKTSLPEDDRGKQLVRKDFIVTDEVRAAYDLLGFPTYGLDNDHGNARGHATDEWIYLPESFKVPSLYTKKIDDPGFGREHQGFSRFLSNGYDDYVVEILKSLNAKTGLVQASKWGFTEVVDHIPHPEDHLEISYQSSEPHIIGTDLKEKLYTISRLNDKLEFAEAISDGYDWVKNDTYQLIEELIIPIGTRLYDGSLSTDERILPVGLCKNSSGVDWQTHLEDSEYSWNHQNWWYPATELACDVLNSTGINPTIPYDEYIPDLNVIENSIGNAVWQPTIIDTVLEFERMSYIENGIVVRQFGFNSDEWEALDSNYKRDTAACSVESVMWLNYCSDSAFGDQNSCELPINVWTVIESGTCSIVEVITGEGDCLTVGGIWTPIFTGSCSNSDYTEESTCLSTPRGIWTDSFEHFIVDENDCLDENATWYDSVYERHEDNINKGKKAEGLFNAWPETTTLEFKNSLRILDYDVLSGANTILDLNKTYKGKKSLSYNDDGEFIGFEFDEEFMATDGSMIACEVWSLLVSRGMETVEKWLSTFVQETDYAPEKSYNIWEVNRENSNVQHVYGRSCDVIDSVRISAFETLDGKSIHNHGQKDGFAPLVETKITKGFELPELSVGVSAFHGHSFDNVSIKNLIVHGVEVTTRSINYSEARALMDREYFEVPHMHGANLVCGGIMTPPLWGDWVDSHQDPRYNGNTHPYGGGECFNSAYDNPMDCIAAYGGNPMFWMPPMCSNMSNMDPSVCASMGDTWVSNTPSSCDDGTSPDHIQCEATGGTWTWEMPSYCMSSESSCNAVGHSWGYFTLAELPAMKGHVSYFVKGQVVDRQRGRTADPLTREQARFLIDNPNETVTLYDNLGYLDDDGGVFFDEFEITIGGTITNIRGEITSGHYHEYSVSYDPDWKNNVDWRDNEKTHGFTYAPVTTWLCFNYDPSLPVDPTIMGGMDFLGNQWPQNVFMNVPDSYVGGFLMNPDITLQHNQVWKEDLNPNVDFVELYSSNHIADVPGVGATGDLIGVQKLGVATDVAVVEAFPNTTQADTVAIVEQYGIIKLMNENDGSMTQFMNLTSLQHVIGLGSFANYDERGVLGLAFHPDYEVNGKFYVYYMTEQGNGTGAWGFPLSTTVISEFTADTNRIECTDLTTERNLFTIPQPDFNHNGGELSFGPDGLLYIGLGDGGSAGDVSWANGHGGHGDYGNAQNPTNLLGTILRVDVNEDVVNNTPYTIPADNPFITSIYKEGQVGQQAFRPEIYAFGFRNPWRFSFSEDGKLWCADVGQDVFEEINIVVAGGNYGWRVMEAYHEFEENQAIIDQIAIDLGYISTFEYLSDLKKPIHEYSHGTGISILGGFVYKGSIQELQGKYIFGDWSTTWAGTSGHLYALTENDDGLSANFNVLANAVNGASHGHTIYLTGSQVTYLKDNPGSPITTIQSDSTHAEFYVHIFTIIWSSQNEEFIIVGQTNPEGHDMLAFDSYGSDLIYDRTPLSIWDPVTEVVDLTTMGESILTMGETNSGEIIFTTRTGIDTFQGSGINNTSLYKITDSYSSVDIPTANVQIPATKTAHVHGYEVRYDENDNEFSIVEVSDIQMSNYDEFWPEWTWNTPASHIHPSTTAWNHKIDEVLDIGSSGGWHYNESNNNWESYDIGADTAWAPPEEETSGYVTVITSPVISVGSSNEFARGTHQHYFSDELLDSFGENYGRRSNTILRAEAEELANAVVEGTKHILYSSIHIELDVKRHYHAYEITYNIATKQFYALEIEEWVETIYGTGVFEKIEIKTHEHPTSIDGILTSVGWSGAPIFDAPNMVIAYANDWLNLTGSETGHNHIFNDSLLDNLGANAGRRATEMSPEQTTQLKNGTLNEVRIFSNVNSLHYHEYLITYDAINDTFDAQEVGLYKTSDAINYTFIPNPTHMHVVAVDGIITGTGFNETIASVNLPTFNSPGYPFPGGSHPHFFNDTVVGPFADGSIEMCNGLTIEKAAGLIDGLVSFFKIYDSLEGAHFHEYTIKWNTNENIFYVAASTTFVRGGIEDGTQDNLKYYPSVIENSAEGLHWHNLTIYWNPNDASSPQQDGGSLYTTKTEETDEILHLDPIVTTTTQSTELNPDSTSYDDMPEVGDTTLVIKFSDLISNTIVSSVTIRTTTTIANYISDGTAYDIVLPTSETIDESITSSSEIIENLDKRQTFINDILQANISPVIWINNTFLDGEGSHDHLLYDGCTLDSEGLYAGRACEPISLSSINELINAQNPNYGIVFYDSPNGNQSHYHSYVLKYNPSVGADGLFIVNSLSMYDRLPGSGSTIHKFKLSGGFHTHDYWCTPSEFISLLSGTQITMTQRDSTHSDIYVHTLTVSYSGQYNIVAQTSNFDGHNLLTYQGEVALGGAWDEVSVQPGDHIHTTVIDDSNTWPID